MTGVILCGGRIEDYQAVKKYFVRDTIVLSADSGAKHCIKFGIVPQILAGDFDSVSDADYHSLVSSGAEIHQFPCEKDMTDSELAIELAIERGCNRIVLLGALGTRADHSLSNIFLLKKLHDAGVEGLLADEHNEIRITSGTMKLEREDGVNITLLPLGGDAEGVTTKGLYYALTDAILETGSSLGVSNRFSEKEAIITVRKGMLLVIKSID